MAFEHSPGLAALHAAIQAQNAGKNQNEEVKKEEDKKARRSRRRARKAPDEKLTS